MAQGKEDRRVRITKLAIKESFIELMQENPASKISVKMICETADINRSTFYAHYTDQYDLLRHIQKETIESIKVRISDLDVIEKNEGTVPVLTQILIYARDNTALFKALLSNEGDESFYNDLVYLAQEKTIEMIREDKRLDVRLSAYLERYIIYGCLSIFRKWLDDGTPEDPEQLAEFVSKLLYQGVSAVYN